MKILMFCCIGHKEVLLELREWLPQIMATKNINCQLVLAVGSQAIQRFNFISTINLHGLWVHKPFNVSTLYQPTFNLQLIMSTGFVVTPTIQR
jgi:hypothetical protein